MNCMMIEMPVAMDPKVRLMNFKHVVETSSSYRRYVILVHTLRLTYAGNYRVWALVSDYYRWFYHFVNIHDIAKLTISQFLIMPPIVVFGTPVPVNGESSSNTKDVVATKCGPAVFNPERMSGTNSGIIVVATDEPMLTFSHVIVGGVAVWPFGIGVDETYSKIANLQGAVASIDQLFVAIPFCVDITYESNLHLATK